MDESRGFMKAIVDAEKLADLGCAVLGLEGGDFRWLCFRLPCSGDLPYTVLRDGIFAIQPWRNR